MNLANIGPDVGRNIRSPRIFRFLNPEGKDGQQRDPSDVLDKNFKRQDLVSRSVVRDEYHNNRYLVFDSRDDLIAWRDGLPIEEKCLHEVIFGWQSQRIKVDIDAPSHKLDEISESTLRLCLPATSDNGQIECKAADPEIEEYLGDLLGGAQSEPTNAEPVLTNDTKRQRDLKMRLILDCVLDTLLEEVASAYYMVESVVATRNEVVVAESCGMSKGQWKYSYHIILLPYTVPDNNEARELTARLVESLPPLIRQFVDAGVNKSIQSFRYPQCTKPGEARFKTVQEDTSRRLGTAFVDVDDATIVCPPEIRVLPRVFTTESITAKRVPIPDETVEVAVKTAADAGVTDGHSVRCVRGSLIIFEREKPTRCAICDEVHHKDNTLMLSLEPVEAGHDGAWPGSGPTAHRLIEHCRHAPGKGRVIAELVCKSSPQEIHASRGANRKAGATDTTCKGVAERISQIKAGKVNPHLAATSAFERLPDFRKTIYSESQMRNYELVGTLAVKAQMKLGKTRALRSYLDTQFPIDGIRTPTIRFITFRQTFSSSLRRGDQFPDFALYSDYQGDLDVARHPRLIVQVESLHRLKMPADPEPIDLVILDEAESILAQFNSGLHKHFSAAFAMFHWLMQTSRHVVCMDANIGDRTYRILEHMRADHPVHFHWNKFERAAEDKYYFTGDQSVWLEKLNAVVRADRAVVVATNSLAEAEALTASLQEDFPEKNISLYSSKTSPSEKSRHFSDVHEYWSRLHVLVYTPTVSAGVSYELEHFDCLFGYFTDTSCDVETCRQMLARVRNLRTKEHYICLRGVPNNLPVHVDDIRRLINDKRAGLYRTVEDSALQFEYTAEGEIKHYESHYFHLWLETVRVENLSRNGFANRFIDQVADTGAQIDVMTTTASQSELMAILNRQKGTKQEIKVAHCDAVAGAEQISQDEASQIRDELSRQVDVSADRRLSYERWHLEEFYSWHGRPLSGDFVANYSKEETKRVYKNLIRITEKESIADSLREMREREASHYQFIMETRTPEHGFVNEGRDLQRDKHVYVFQAHFYAIWLLRTCGFICITDRSWIHCEVLESRLRIALPSLDKASAGISFEFGTRRPFLHRLKPEPNNQKFISGMLRFINPVLRSMYGIEIKRVSKRVGGDSYFLSHTKVGLLFVLSDDPVADDAPGGPRPHITSKLKPIQINTVAQFIDEAYVIRANAHQEPAYATDDDPPPEYHDGPPTRARTSACTSAIYPKQSESNATLASRACTRAYNTPTEAGMIDFLNMAHIAYRM